MDKLKEDKTRAVDYSEVELTRSSSVDHTAPLTEDDWADLMIMFPEPRLSDDQR
jgi:hypothetical protein